MLSARVVLTNGNYLKDVDVTMAAATIKQVPWKINHTFILTETEHKLHQERLLRNIFDLEEKNLKSTWEWTYMISGNNMMLLATIKLKSNKWQASWRSYSMTLLFKLNERLKSSPKVLLYKLWVDLKRNIKFENDCMKYCGFVPTKHNQQVLVVSSQI